MRLYHSPSVSPHGRYRSAAYHGAKSQQTRIAQGEISRCNVYQPLGKGEGGTKQVARGAALRCCSEGGTCPMVECWYNAQPAVVRNAGPPAHPLHTRGHGTTSSWGAFSKPALGPVGDGLDELQ
jgi:hypothetical protein